MPSAGPPRSEKLASEMAEGPRVGTGAGSSGSAWSSSRPGSVPPITPACSRPALGDDARALQSLEKAYERHDETILYVKVDPEWDRLRSDPRFTAIVRKIGLP